MINKSLSWNINQQLNKSKKVLFDTHLIVKMINKFNINRKHQVLLVGKEIQSIRDFFSFYAQDIFIIDFHKNQFNAFTDIAQEAESSFQHSIIEFKSKILFDYIIFTQHINSFPANLIWFKLKRDGKLIIPSMNFKKEKSVLVYSNRSGLDECENITDADFITL